MFKQGLLQHDFRIKEWVDQMQKELITLTDTASGMDNLIQIYHKHRPHFSVETNDARHLVATAAGNIEKLLSKRSQALKITCSAGSVCWRRDELSSQHTAVRERDQHRALTGHFLRKLSRIDLTKVLPVTTADAHVSAQLSRVSLHISEMAGKLMWLQEQGTLWMDHAVRLWP
ncbi:Voltage-dependent calcium channel subunit alpha-2/delta-1 [Liparis tanakae]|uniref:Voltage-dependent calcium channel subunit alpha-2/delta-1 n=1 Tax=Liparis tanakae TaxID=230148 RepID=A0A4Z2GUH4_9TELE|nr:Voltage-dependent calcium channel subunit alpha-2/delta-1 [Liparis tanakae]